MALKIADRVRETTTTEGTGTISLGGAVGNFETFSANLSNSDTTYYAIVDSTNNTFEVGLGTYASSGNTLARTTVIASSNSNSAVNFGTATKDVFITTPASKMAFLDASGNLISTGGSSVVNTDLSNDTSPQLGGNLDLNGNDIVTTSNADLELAPNGTGHVTVKGNTNQGAIQFNCENNSHGQILKAAPHSESASNTLTLPSTGGDVNLVSTASTATLTNKTFGDNVSFGDNNITNVGDIAVDSISADGTDINVAVSDNSATAFTIKQSTNNYLVIDTGDGGESVAIGTGVSGTAISIGHTTSETTVNDNLTVTGDFTVNGTTTTVDTTNTTVKDSLLELNSGATSNSNDCGIVIERGSTGDNAILMWDESADTFVVGTTTATGASTGNLTVTDGALQAGSLDISGNVDVDGTLEADAMTLNGTAITTTATLSTGISNTNVLVANANIVDNDFLRVDGTSIEGRSASELATDIGAATTDDATALAIALG
jgi:hypothetical protein